MYTTKLLLFVLMASSFCVAAITGTITNTAGIALAGASIQLEKAGWTTVSEQDGRFTLSSTVKIFKTGNNSMNNGISVRFRGGYLLVNVPEKTTVEITPFRLDGKVFLSVQQTVDAGIHDILLPQKSTEICLYRIRIGNDAFIAKSNSIAGVVYKTVESSNGTYQETNLSKSVNTSAVINDVIAVTKIGFINYRVAVYNSDSNGIVIKLVANAGNIMDGDGSIYQTVMIGTRQWMAENLRTTKYNDGTAIPWVTDNATWAALTTPGRCYYDNTANTDSIKKYGALYNWYTVSPTNPKKIAPLGWHVPTDAEWSTLVVYLTINGFNYDGTTLGNKAAKSLAAKTDWLTSSVVGAVGNNPATNNQTGFTGLPGGHRNGLGPCFGIGTSGDWWSITENDATSAWERYLGYDYEAMGRFSFYTKRNGFSVRCVKD